MFLKFQAPVWWETSYEDTCDNTTIGFGPYKIVDWKQATEVELAEFENYKLNVSFDSQAPIIQGRSQVWQDDKFNRAAMIETGGTDLAFDIGFKNIEIVPRALARTNNEI